MICQLNFHGSFISDRAHPLQLLADILRGSKAASAGLQWRNLTKEVFTATKLVVSEAAQLIRKGREHGPASELSRSKQNYVFDFPVSGYKFRSLFSAGQAT